MHSRLILTLLALLTFPLLGHAACSDPAGSEGEIIYNKTYKIPVYCNGTDWIAWGSGYSQSGGWTTSGSDIYFDGGNVGIGTTSPTTKLEIGGTSGVDGIKFPDSTTQTTAFQGIMTIRTNVSTFGLANGASLSRTASCLAGEVATGGGCQDGGYKMFYIFRPTTNGYQCYWYNTSGSYVTITNGTVYVNCLK